MGDSAARCPAHSARTSCPTNAHPPGFFPPEHPPAAGRAAQCHQRSSPTVETACSGEVGLVPSPAEWGGAGKSEPPQPVRPGTVCGEQPSPGPSGRGLWGRQRRGRHQCSKASGTPGEIHLGHSCKPQSGFRAQSWVEAPNWNLHESREGQCSLVPETQVCTGSAGSKTRKERLRKATRKVRGRGRRKVSRGRQCWTETALDGQDALVRQRTFGWVHRSGAERPQEPNLPGRRGGSC